MVDFIGKDDGEIIEAVNTALGMQHRSKLYDLKNSEDLIEAAKMATAEYLDLWDYSRQLDNILEEYDEALEHYHTSTWFQLGEKKNDPFAKAYFQYLCFDVELPKLHMTIAGKILICIIKGWRDFFKIKSCNWAKITILIQRVFVELFTPKCIIIMLLFI